MPTRVVIVLKGGNFVPCDCDSPENASDFIETWVKRDDDINKGLPPQRPKMIYGTRGKHMQFAILADQIAGMYIQGTTTADRVASAVEKIAQDATEGDDWKG